MQKHPSCGFRAGIYVAVLASAAVVLLAAHGAPPSIDYPPRGQEVILYQQAAFGVIASGTPPLEYQWLKNGVPIPRATNDQIVIRSVKFSDEGLYSALVSNAEGSVHSGDAELMVKLPRAGEVDGSFSSGGLINGPVHAVAVQPDGKVLIGGDFTTMHGASHSRIGRLNLDGATDHTFLNGLSGANGIVFAVALQSDGKVLIGGGFNTVNGIDRKGIARLHPDGTVDNTFAVPVKGTVRAIVLQGDGRVLLGGTFLDSSSSNQMNIARANSNGTLDSTFQAQLIRHPVLSVALQKDGRIMVGTQSTTMEPVNSAEMVRLNSDGTLDASLQTTVSMSGYGRALVSAITPLPDGRVLVGGTFNKINGASAVDFALLDAKGDLDPTFNRILTQSTYLGITAIAVEREGKIIIGGRLNPGGGEQAGILRLSAEGSLDEDFQTTATGLSYPTIYSIGVQPDGKLIFGGDFTTVNNEQQSRIARLNSDGTVDSSFQNGAIPFSGRIDAIAVQNDDRVVIGGFFTNVHGSRKTGIARLHADGTLDSSFQTELSPWRNFAAIRRMAFQADGKLFITGLFTAVNGVSRMYIVRLTRDGSLDTTFETPHLTFSPFEVPDLDAILVQDDGKVLLQGEFTKVNNVERRNLARLHCDGSLDQSFQPAVATGSIALQRDGKILIGGSFTNSNGGARAIARLNSDGTLDEGFETVLLLPGYYPARFDNLTVQHDGKVLAQARFSTTNLYGPPTNSLVRLNPNGSLDETFQTELSLHGWYEIGSIAIQSDGKILVLYYYDIWWPGWRTAIARLNPDGTWDSSFRNRPGGADGAHPIAFQSDGNILIGGVFTTMQEMPVLTLARLWTTDFPPVTRSIRRGEWESCMTWRAIPDRTYRVQYTDELSAETCIDLPGDVQAEGHSAHKTDASAGGGQRFYRVVRLP
jgi:uncharacterized delta-60 repeat protein